MMPQKKIRQCNLNYKLITIALASALLAGCQIWPDYKRADVGLPGTYSASADLAEANLAAAIPKDWWVLYQDPLLSGYVTSALKNNTSIQMAVAKIEESDAYAREVGAARLPQFNLTSSAVKRRVTELGQVPVFGGSPTQNNFTLGIGTVFELDFWGKVRRARESATALALSNRYSRDTVALSLSSLVASQYFLICSLDAQIAITQSNLKSRQDSLDLTQKRFNGGIVSALDVHQSEVIVYNLQAQLPELARQRAITEHQLAVLTGVLDLTVPVSDLKGLPLPPMPPLGLPSAILESRPDVQQAEQQLIAANANIGVAKAALYPTISLTGRFGGESALLSNLLKSGARVWTLGLDLALPIFDSGRLNSKVDQVSAKQKQALAAYSETIQTAFRETNDALVNVRQYREREQILENAKMASTKALDIAKTRYKSGYSAYLDVLEAERNQNDISLSYVQARQARLIASVDLIKALGGGWQDTNKTASK